MPALFATFVTLYFLAQMFLWWPLLEITRGAWTVFAALFTLNTALNLAGYFRAARES